MPHVDAWPPAEVLTEVVGEELAAPAAAARDAYKAAWAAVEALEAHRPGPLGSAFRAALHDDLEAYEPGKPARASKVVKIVDGDLQRWVAAHQAVRYLPKARAAAMDALDRDGIEVVLSKVMDAAATEFAREAATAWEKRDDTADAWQHFNRATEVLAGFSRAVCVRWFVLGQGWDDPKTREYRPDDAVAWGHYRATELWLHPQLKLVTLPRDVVWPAGIETRIGVAMPAGYASLLTRGFAEPEEVTPRRGPSRVR